MKSQSLKLFAMAFVLGLAVVFGAGSASAQTVMKFETAFDFHVGKDNLTAGKYELQRVSTNAYVLRNAETNESRIVAFTVTAKGERGERPERVVFNRYGETYFLSSIYDSRVADGKQLSETSFERKIRQQGGENEPRLAGGKAKTEKVSVNLMK